MKLNCACTVILPSVGQNVFVDPPNLKPLMDSSHYEHFLPPNANPVWQRVDNDDNNPVGISTTSSCISMSVDPAAARETSNYQLVESLTTQGTSGQTTLKETENINFNSQDTGLYLAFRDPGTCILISRVVVYYHVCPVGSASLVIRPETIAPMIGSGATMEVSANCIPNASPRSGGSAKLTCGERGIWLQPMTSDCVCEEGFIETEDGQHCLPCDPGFYASVANNMCMMCPNNSNSTEQGLAECPCNEGFYRTQEEIDLPCTQPPSPPRNVVVVNFTSTVISLSWEEPEFTGGRSRDEIRYSLWYKVNGKLVFFNTVYTTTGEITDLIPGVQYQVIVSAENEISYQVPDNLFENRAVSQIVVTAPSTIPTIASFNTISMIAETSESKNTANTMSMKTGMPNESTSTLSRDIIVGVVVAMLVMAAIIAIVISTAVVCYKNKNDNKTNVNPVIELSENPSYGTTRQGAQSCDDQSIYDVIETHDDNDNLYEVPQCHL